jgi:transcription termination factor Rho
MREMKLKDLKQKTPTELLQKAEELEVENASTMRKQELMFATLKQLAMNDVEIIGTGVVEVLQDGFGFLRSPDANYLPGPDDIYISPSQSGGLHCGPGILSKGTSAARRMVSGTLRSSRSIRSTSKSPKRSNIRSTSTT